MTIAFPLLRREEPPSEPAPQQAPAAAEPQPEAALAPQEGGSMGTLEQCVATVRHAFRVARRRAKDLAERDGGWVNAGLNGRPPSVNDQRDYLANRSWLPPGHEGGIADLEGQAYMVAIGIPGVAAGNAVSWLQARQFHFWWALAGWAAAVALLLWLCRHLVPLSSRTIALCSLGPPAAAIAWIAAVAGVLLLRRTWHRSRNPQGGLT